ncbi:MAG: hypothetical protein HQK51_13710 [Oligoflexia bacterium]|nr:hypothetical protein [Oligoflexia bacterium]
MDINSSHNSEPLHLNQWVVINRILVFYKLIALITGIISILLTIHVLYLSAQPPIVIESGKSGNHIVKADVTNPTITKIDLEEVTKNFIHLRYEWLEINPEHILVSLKPWVTTGLLKKIEKDLDELRLRNKKEHDGDGSEKNNGSNSSNSSNNSGDSKDGGSKTIKQRVLVNSIDVTEKSVKAEFDRIINIEGMKVVSTLQIEIEIIQGEITYKNPLSLYVNGVTEYDKD